MKDDATFWEFYPINSDGDMDVYEIDRSVVKKTTLRVSNHY
jgi:hypothetical protein